MYPQGRRGLGEATVDHGLADLVLGIADFTPKITDFGLAKLLVTDAQGLTRTNELLGTPSYMAPEQTTGKTREIGPVVDVYALGAVLYQLLTGRPPFLADTPWATLLQVQHEEAAEGQPPAA